MVKFNLKKYLVYIFIAVLSSLILLPNLSKAFIGHHDWNGVFYANIAKNYLRFGLLITKLGQMTSPGSFYTHYPPLMPMILALNFKLLGASDLTARLLPFGLTLLSLLTVFRITQKLKLKNFIGCSSVLIVATPMLRYFSHMPSQETLMIFLTLLSAYFFLAGKSAYFYLTVILNGLSGWAGYFFYPLLFFLNRRWAIKACLLLLTTFSLHLIHTYSLTGSVIGGGLFDAMLLRLGLFPLLGKTEPELPGQFTYPKYFIQQIHWLSAYYTVALIVIAFIGLCFIVKKLISRKPLKLIEKMVLVFLFWGLAYPVIFSNVVFIHDYFNIFFWPFFSLSLAYLLDSSKRFFKLSTINTNLLILSFFFLIYTERHSFLQALYQTQAFLPGYKLGTLINQTVPNNQTAYIVADNQFSSSQGIFIEYYADRSVIFISEPSSLPLGAEYIFYQNDMID